MLLVSLLLTTNIMEIFLDVNTRQNTLLPWPKSIYVLSMCFKVRLRIIFFGNLQIKFFAIICLDCEQYGKNYKKGKQSTYSHCSKF